MFEDKVIIDTNFLLIPGQFNVNIFSEIDRIMTSKYKLLIIDRTINELESIVDGSKGKDSRAAKLGIALVGSLIKQKSLKTITSSHRHVDDDIVAKTTKKVYVATQDRELKSRVKAKGGRIITLKQKKYLGFE